VSGAASAPVSSPSYVIRPSRGETRAVALVLPGGRADSFDATHPRHLSGVRMIPFARLLHRRGAEAGLAVWSVRYRVRGWNGEEMSPVTDVLRVLEQVRERYGDVPLVLVGHSMGARTAVRVAGHANVVGVVALAPWLPKSDPVDQLRGRRLLIAHGTLDRVTSPRASQRFAGRAEGVAADVTFIAVRGETHAMLLRPAFWHRLAADRALADLGL
jgi:dienelactone hydrolase